MSSSGLQGSASTPLGRLPGGAVAQTVEQAKQARSSRTSMLSIVVLPTQTCCTRGLTAALWRRHGRACGRDEHAQSCMCYLPGAPRGQERSITPDMHEIVSGARRITPDTCIRCRQLRGAPDAAPLSPHLHARAGSSGALLTHCTREVRSLRVPPRLERS